MNFVVNGLHKSAFYFLMFAYRSALFNLHAIWHLILGLQVRIDHLTGNRTTHESSETD